MASFKLTKLTSTVFLNPVSVSLIIPAAFTTASNFPPNSLCAAWKKSEIKIPNSTYVPIMTLSENGIVL